MSLVYLQKKSDRLEIFLTPAGRQELSERLDNGQLIGTDDVLFDLLERHLCNGWEIIRPEEIGALTDAPIISDDVLRDDDGELVDVGSVYWFPQYQVRSPSSDLYHFGQIDFQRAE